MRTEVASQTRDIKGYSPPSEAKLRGSLTVQLRPSPLEQDPADTVGVHWAEDCVITGSVIIKIFWEVQIVR